MRYVVTQEFKTPLRRFRVGDEVDEADVDGPLTAIDWASKGYLGPVAASEEDLTALHAEAAALGMEVDGRWGAARLREEIEAKKAANQEAARLLAEKAEAPAPAEAVATEDLPGEQSDTGRRRR